MYIPDDPNPPRFSTDEEREAYAEQVAAARKVQVVPYAVAPGRVVVLNGGARLPAGAEVRLNHLRGFKRPPAEELEIHLAHGRVIAREGLEPGTPA